MKKRTKGLHPGDIQRGNRDWWTKNPMAYDWHGEIPYQRFSREWFDAIDAAHVWGVRLFATQDSPFDRVMPLDQLAGKRVLEIGCGMGLHTETMVRAGASVTAIDITSTAVEAVKRRLEMKDLRATVLQVDAEKLPFDSRSFDFVWSWGVIHHSANTGRIVRQIARVLEPHGECRAMVYNREGMAAKITLLKDHLLRGGFLRGSYEETLYRHTDGFSARYYVAEQFEDLFRSFFQKVRSEICGLDADAIPLPRRLRALALRFVPRAYLQAGQARRGSFIFLNASEPD